MRRARAGKLIVVAAALLLGVAPQRSIEILGGNPDVYRARRVKFLDAMQGTGIAVVMSARRNQEDIFEGFVPHADNHDFIYLTGLDGRDSLDSALVLAAGAQQYREVLYTSGDVDAVGRATGIRHVLPFTQLTVDLSEALTDFSLIRGHQRGSKPRPTDFSRSLGVTKHLYLNYPRFLNLDAAPPPRLELSRKLQYFSPEIDLRDASDILDRLRMIHDESEIALLRRASAIAVKAFVESAKMVRPGITTREIAAKVDYVFAAERAAPSFRSNVGNWALGSGHFADRAVEAGDLISYDIGAEIGHQTSDFGRTIPVSGTFTLDQRRLYDTAVRIQRQLIASVKPGGTFRELQALKNRLTAEAGFGGKTVDYGISHFVGMEIHDVGDYERPFEPNMCFVVEWRVETQGVMIRFEDVLLVTENGHEWLTASAPIEADEYAALMLAANSNSR